MKEKGLFIEQAIGTFSDLNDDVISSLQGVCQTVICSIETASERLIGLINKPIKLSKIPEINQKLYAAGINTIHNFMFGLPTETDDDRKDAVALMIKLKKINPYVRGVAYFFTPIPGTPMLEDVEKDYGKYPQTLSYWSDCEIIGFQHSFKYRPWLGEEEQIFISQFATLFKEIFQSINEPLNEQQQNKINNSDRLRYIFAGIESVDFPADKTSKYLLDKKLKEQGYI